MQWMENLIRSLTTKKYIFLLIAVTIFLAGCENTDEKWEKTDLRFIELSKHGDGYMGPVAIFASDSEKTYYEMSISSYEYNNWEMKEEDILKDVYIRENVLDFFAYTYKAKINGKKEDLKRLDYYFEKK